MAYIVNNTPISSANQITSTQTTNISAGTVQSAIAELDAEKVQQTSSTGAASIPAGTTAQRPSSPAPGYIRFNTDLGKAEVWTGSIWGSVGGGATGGSNDDAFYENSNTINNSYTITTGKNAMTAGPVTIGGSAVVSIPDNSTWVIV